MPRSDQALVLRPRARWMLSGVLMAWLALIGGCSFEPGLQPGLQEADGGLADASTQDANTDGGELPVDVGELPDVTGDVGAVDGGQDGGPRGTPDSGGQDAGAPDSGPDTGADGGVDAGRQWAECDGQTVDLNRDPDHCGACGNACDPDFGRCAAGECACEAGLAPCGPEGRCTARDFDPDHCGSCDNACDPGEACVEGQCECRAGLMRCGGECIDPQSDPRHCGGCDVSCGADACRQGNCRGNDRCGPATATSCPGPDGGQACVDEETNPLHCGAGTLDPCGTVCAADQVCVDPGVLAAARCVDYRAGRGCTGCPCDDCGADETCFTSENIPGTAFCLAD